MSRGNSVQSQANRLEEALLAAARDGALALPYLTVDFGKAALKGGLTEITSLDAPHRVYDAILRDSLLEEIPFMRSSLGLRLAEAKPADATALLEASPTALLFGAWHSTGEGGGLGAKFARCLTSEIVAVNTPVEFFVPDQRTKEPEARTSGQRTGSRLDPLGILSRVQLFKGDDGWDVSSQGAGKNAKKAKPSEINHGNIAPSVQPLGVTCDYAEHTAVIGFAGLRRLGFGDAVRNSAGRAFLAALGLAALMEQDLRGYALRSRCELTIDEVAGVAPIELVKFDGTTEAVTIDVRGARELYAEALDAAKRAGFAFADGPIRLIPQEKLIAIVRESQDRAMVGHGGDPDTSAG